MKYYSSTTTATIHTYTVNCGEYVCSYDPHRVVVLFAAVAQESPKAVTEYIATYLRQGGNPISDMSTRVEEGIRELCEFILFVAKSIRDNGDNTATSVFNYTDLNTGKSFVWVHSVC